MTLTGLSPGEAAARLKSEGYNELPGAKKRGVLAIAAGVAREPMLLLLIAAGSIYLALGEPADALLLLGFIFFIIGIILVQERRTERALEALRGLSSPRALVIRGGEQKRIAGREVVRQDIVLVSEGDRIPADAVLLSAANLSVDESILTGESVPVRKRAGRPGDAAVRPGGENLPYIFSGTLVVQGQGIARVTATGPRTAVGRIGASLGALKQESTPLQKDTGRLVRSIAVIGASLCALIIVVYGLTRHDWLAGFLAGLALAMAILPEEFPVVLTIFLSLGALRISRKQVLTRRIPAVETLGAATVLCVDKTGTITQNRMTVRLLDADERSLEIGARPESLPESFHPLVEFSILASKLNPFDPMEKAFRELGEKTLSTTEHIHRDWVLVQEYPLEPQLLAMSRVWRSPEGMNYVIAAKGSPEAVLDLCHVPPKRRGELLVRAAGMASLGLRVLGVARSSYFRLSPLPGGQHDFAFQFLGFIGLEDPVRPEVPQAVRECREAGIRVVMITGDYPETAKNIASRAGLRHPDKVVTGNELGEAGDEAIASANVFARVLPEQKLDIVKALKSRGEIVAMTGDGVNDAPALKAADIGIAMGGRGTDVAREAASLVLLNDDFSSIVAAVRTGRRVYDNLRKAMAYIVSVHVPIAGMAALPVIFGFPLVLLPVHIVFLQLIIDPASSIVFEAEPAEPDVMRRPPRPVTEPLFGKRMISLSFFQGLSVLVTLLAVYGLALLLGENAASARTLAFTTLIIANLNLILSNRSWSRTVFQCFSARNRALAVIVACTVILLGIILYVPAFQRLFHFTTLHPIDIAVSIVAGGISILWFEGFKLFHKVRKT